MGLAVTVNGNVIVGARVFSGAPYESLYLHEQMAQASIFFHDSADNPTEAVVDLGHRGLEADNPAQAIASPGKARRLSTEDCKLPTGRNDRAGDRASEGRPSDRPLSPQGRDSRPAACGAVRGGNLRWFLRMMVMEGLIAVLWLLPGRVRCAVEDVFGTARASPPSEFVLPLRSAA